MAVALAPVFSFQMANYAYWDVDASDSDIQDLVDSAQRSFFSPKREEEKIDSASTAGTTALPPHQQQQETPPPVVSLSVQQLYDELLRLLVPKGVAYQLSATTTTSPAPAAAVSGSDAATASDASTEAAKSTQQDGAPEGERNAPPPSSSLIVGYPFVLTARRSDSLFPLMVLSSTEQRPLLDVLPKAPLLSNVPTTAATTNATPVHVTVVLSPRLGSAVPRREESQGLKPLMAALWVAGADEASPKKAAAVAGEKKRAPAKAAARKKT